ncbi:unnamed protein product [Phytophthora fragariaefolia]|uniref:Unnamed protein product n=1 Tax=Phytophthora fragariaefolia TaxID=1490495 RepID=A0A9W6XWC8_9STRA|nr:unnamed protein product [Phytophthora fragariaefolia]
MARWLPLLADAAVAALLLLLDVRDLWFKLRWVGPRDAFAFSTVVTKSLPAPGAAPLRPTATFSYDGQRSQRVSGWSSFLQRCEALTALPEDHPAQSFHSAVGKNCMIGATGSAVQTPELFLTSSIPVDSMAWSACELLYKHRKPPICHSPIVTEFTERHNLQNELAAKPSAIDPVKRVGNAGISEPYAIKPGSEAETELIELLEVIGKSSPISAVVCVEAFALKGPGTYTATMYGCGSPSFYQSVFIGMKIPFLGLFQQDKGWLTSNAIRIMGMTLLIRENRRSIFTVKDEALDSGAGRILQHNMSVNYAASGSLYILVVLADLVLLAFNICGAVETARFMLWPLWKPLFVSEYQMSSARTTKMGLRVGDFSQVLQAGLIRSNPVIMLIIFSRLLSWMLVLPCAVLWRDGNLTSGDVHTFLTLVRCCDLVVICINYLWDVAVAHREGHALMFVRETHVTPLEITSIGITIAFVGIYQYWSFMPCQFDRKQQIDRTSFQNVTAIANTFGVHREYELTTTTTTINVYGPLLAMIGISVLLIGAVVVSRFTVGRLVPSRSLVQAPVSVVQPSATKEFPVASFRSIHSDLTSSSAGILMCSPSPPPSPARKESDSQSESAYLLEVSNDRVPIESVLDNPIRARSLVRSSTALEKQANGQVLLLPSFYVTFGIMLIGRFMKTRCGFMDVVQPVVLAREHQQHCEYENDSQTMLERHFRVNLR